MSRPQRMDQRALPATQSSMTRYSAHLKLPLRQDHSIVAIHGIGAHPDDTWCKEVGTDEEGRARYVNWLKDKHMLPSVVPNARIMRYGYESQWFGTDAIRQKASTVANRFLLALKRKRKVRVLKSPRPFLVANRARLPRSTHPAPCYLLHTASVG